MTSSAANRITAVNLNPGTRYKKSVKPPSESILKPGKNNAKLGDKITRKRWQGMPIYSLTLEERATCPSDCDQWNNCYGNNMPFGHRYDHTHPDFYDRLRSHVQQLIQKHQQIVVRLHILGDFVDAEYINEWSNLLETHPGLHVWGYTHHKVSTDLGQRIVKLNQLYTDRFRVRFSDDPSTQFAAYTPSTAPENCSKAIICPEQLGKTESCATCGYCWSSENPVIFLEH